MSSSDRGAGTDPYTAALDMLRRRLRAGEVGAGEPLTVADAAGALRLSATPVREALAHLAGEGLIERRRGRGYVVRRLDGVDLQELDGLRQLYLLAALARDPGGPRPAPAAGRSPEDRLDEVLLAIVERSDNAALIEAYRRLADRLAPAGPAERRMFPVAAEAERLMGAAAGADEAVVVTALHEARRLKASEIAQAMRARRPISRI